MPSTIGARRSSATGSRRFARAGWRLRTRSGGGCRSTASPAWLSTSTSTARSCCRTASAATASSPARWALPEMLLVLEVGNTNTKVGVYEGDTLRVSWRLTTRREQTADEYGMFIETLLRSRGIEPAKIHGIALSNVVPPIQQTLEWMCEKYFNLSAFSVEPGVTPAL